MNSLFSEIPLCFNCSVYGGSFSAFKINGIKNYRTKIVGTSHLNTNKHTLKLDEDNLTLDGTVYNMKDFPMITNIYCKNDEIFFNDEKTNIFDLIKEKKIEKVREEPKLTVQMKPKTYSKKPTAKKNKKTLTKE